MGSSPLIKSDIAARRLKVLFPTGVEASSSLLDSLSAALDSSLLPTPQDPKTMDLRAEILARPIQLEDNNGFELGSARDILTEVAVTPQTLEKLKVSQKKLRHFPFYFTNS